MVLCFVGILHEPPIEFQPEKWCHELTQALHRALRRLEGLQELGNSQRVWSLQGPFLDTGAAEHPQGCRGGQVSGPA